MNILVVQLIFAYVSLSVYARSRPLQEFVLPLPIDEVLDDDQFIQMTKPNRFCGQQLMSTLSMVCSMPPLLIPRKLHNRPEESLPLMCCMRRCTMFEMTKFCVNQQYENDLYYIQD